MERKFYEKTQGDNKITKVNTSSDASYQADEKDNITRSITNLSQDSKEKLIHEAFKFHSKGNIPQAIKHYQYLINKGFHDHRIFCNYGSILKDLGKLKEAELYIRKAIKLNPKSANAHYNLGAIFNELGKLKEAELFLRKAIELNPDFVNAYYSLGSILNNLGKLKEAESFLRKAIELNSELVEAHLTLGQILRDKGQLKEALKYTKKAIAIRPWSILGSYSFNRKMISNSSHNS